MSLNYFCQRYYDPEIGRFMELDSWTNLPDDERLLSYEKYLSWDNYQMKCTPQQPKGMSAYRSKYTNQNLAYDTLSSTLHSVAMKRSLSLDASLILVYPMNLMNYGMKPSRYLTYNQQLNGYLYCINNPLRYIDPVGCVWDAKTWYVNTLTFYFGALALYISKDPFKTGFVGYYCNWALDWYWDKCFDYWLHLDDEYLQGAH